MEPMSPIAGGPDYDLAWEQGDTIWVAEVKSLAESNETSRSALRSVRCSTTRISCDGSRSSKYGQ